MDPVVRHLGGFRWQGVPLRDYTAREGTFRDVTRQLLYGAGAAELRYFELEPRGGTTLERHRHEHEVMALRGEGRCLVGDAIFELRPFDLVRVPPLRWHQFRAPPQAPFGFLCLVDRERDRPLRPTPEELEALRADPEIAAFLRV